MKIWHIAALVLGLGIVYVLLKPRGKLIPGSDADVGTSNAVVSLAGGLVSLGNKLFAPSVTKPTVNTGKTVGNYGTVPPLSSGSYGSQPGEAGYVAPGTFYGPDINPSTGEWLQ